jgi:hypothetical protein
MSDEEAAKEWSRERSARRRPFEPGDIVERLDKRHTRTAKFKVRRLNITMTEEGLAMVDARRALLNFGRGMTRSEFLEMLARHYCKSGPAAKEFQKMWREEQDEQVGAG